MTEILLTKDKDKHASIACARIWRSHTDQIPNRNGNAASDDESTAFLQSVGPVYMDRKRYGTNDVDWNGHIVDFERSISGP